MILLVRHTATAAPPGLCHGRTEVPLADSFPDEAAAVRACVEAALDGRAFSLHSSPAGRCRRLAEVFGVPFAIDPRLQELDFGDWEGRAWDALPRAALDAWGDDFVRVGPPGGERFSDLAVRAEAALAALSGHAVVVTHAGVIRALLAPRRGLSLADAFGLPVMFGSLHRLEEGSPR